MEKLANKFSTYNSRARLCCVVLLLAPVLVEIFFLIPESREFSPTIAIIAIVYAICNVAIIITRISGTKAMKECFPTLLPAQQFLLPSDNYLGTETKARYYAFLEKNIDNFKIRPTDDDMKDMVETAVAWLIAKTRDETKFPLIAEENINFGLSYNLLGLKGKGISVSVICILVNIVLLFTNNSTVYPVPLLVFCLCCDCGFLVFWIFFVTKKVVRQSGKKYARALLSACDQL